ncbi:MAG: phosphoribosylanthranilate isomerase [Synergistaceae bacterium]|jgi:phosphoribosylanthranilate isomerase|nr:phosphoribosylanthranilate isomerase [Synergistaceae bacterium]
MMDMMDMMASEVKIKICGLSRQEDLNLCVRSKVDFVGFIFALESPRAVTPSAAARLESQDVERVGVFVNRPVEEILSVVREARLDRVQLHGREPLPQVRAIAHAIGAERVVKVFWPLAEGLEGLEGLEELEREMALYADSAACFLFDGGRDGGGQGQVLPLKVLRLLKEKSPRPFFVAGGLGPENAAELAEKITPFGLDLNSALESAPGKKDPAKVIKALEAIRRIKK